ncbi:MAG: TetR/AcrR family transcriptional regulator [Rhodanobacter sp.]|nr:MAG: TetR/AcrR family transcriptional regulator [Rhodanobacter sp.]TAM38651.1 MAG: TetR/AcrR family transcriptional regulator [Rhodanobacter sp.]TAN23676.1 MAG: TetR/AcrR family transcriptional regulator [Rhodanobacter sp.]
MARTIEFNPASARDNALVLFWRKGYQATSLADLLEAMAISRSSFYATFVDKRSLFLACLDLFAQRTIGMLAQARAELPPLEALQTFYARNFVGARGNRSRWGCMLVNTALEMADVDDELSARASAYLDAVKAEFEGCLLDARCASAHAAELADLLMLLNEGVRVSSRRNLAPDQITAAIETTFRLIRSDLA